MSENFLAFINKYPLNRIAEWDESTVMSLLEDLKARKSCNKDDMNDYMDWKHLFLEFYPALCHEIFSKSFNEDGNRKRAFWKLIEFYLDFIHEALCQRDRDGLFFIDIYVKIISNPFNAYFSPSKINTEFDDNWRLRFRQSDIETEQQSKSPFFQLKAEEVNLSPIFVAIADYFASIGGYEKILWFLEAISVSKDLLEYQHPNPTLLDSSNTNTLLSTKDHTISQGKIFVACFTRMQLIMTETFQSSLADSFMSAILRYLLALPEKEFNVGSMKPISEILKFAEGFCTNCLKYTRIFESVNFFMMQLSYRFFRVSLLDKRVFSLNLLNVVLGNIINYTPVSHQNSHKRGVLVRKEETLPEDDASNRPVIDLQFFLKWLDKIEFIKYALSSDSHAEILRQSSQIFTILAKQGLLNANHVKELWDIANGRHSSIKKVLFDILLEIIPKVINHDLIEFIALKVRKFSPKDVDDVTLDFLVNITLLTEKLHNEKESEILMAPADESIFENSPFRRNFGLFLIWRLTLNKSNVTPEFRMKVFLRLKKLVLATEFQNHRIAFCKECIRFIKSNRSVTQSCLLLKELLDSFPKRKLWKKESLSAVIATLDEEDHIVQVIVQNILEYKENAKNLISVVIESKRANLNLSCLSNDNYDTQPHLMHVKERLNILEYVLKFSKLTLSINDLDILWNSLVTGSLTLEERDLMFSWIGKSNVCSPQGFKAFDNDVLYEIFERLVKIGDSSIQSPSAYNLYFRLFLNLNEKNGRLKVSNGTENGTGSQTNSVISLISEDPPMGGVGSANASHSDLITGEDAVTYNNNSNSYEDITDRPIFEVFDYKRLEGLDFYWKLLLSGPSSKIIDLVTYDLVSLALSTSNKLKIAKRVKTIDRFLDRWSLLLDEKIKSLKQSSKEAISPISCLLKLYSVFISMCQEKGISLTTEKSENMTVNRSENLLNMISSKFSRQKSKDGRNYSLNFIVDGVPRLTMVVSSLDPVEVVKKMVCPKIDKNLSPESVKFLSRGVELVDGKCIGDFGLLDNQDIYVVMTDTKLNKIPSLTDLQTISKKSQSMEDVSSVDSDAKIKLLRRLSTTKQFQEIPVLKYFLKNSYFSPLLLLLPNRIPRELSFAAWNNLRCLPPAPDAVDHFLAEIKCLSGSVASANAWSQIFHNQDIFIFINVLYITRYLFAREGVFKYSDTLVAGGGLEFLIEHTSEILNHSKRYDLEVNVLEEVIKSCLDTIETLVLNIKTVSENPKVILAIMLSQVIPLSFSPLSFPIPAISINSEFPVFINSHIGVIPDAVMKSFLSSLFLFTDRYRMTMEDTTEADHSVLVKSLRLIMAVIINKPELVELGDGIKSWIISNFQICERNEEYQSIFLLGISELFKQAKIKHSRNDNVDGLQRFTSLIRFWLNTFIEHQIENGLGRNLHVIKQRNKPKVEIVLTESVFQFLEILLEDYRLFDQSDSKLYNSYVNGILDYIVSSRGDDYFRHSQDFIICGQLKTASKLIKILAQHNRLKISDSLVMKEVVISCLYSFTESFHKFHVVGNTMAESEFVPLSEKVIIAGYSMLKELAHSELKNMKSICSTFSELIEKSEFPRNVSGILAEASEMNEGLRDSSTPTRYLGLRNLGCTCYINSLMQQLYHDTRFRSFVLSKSRKVLEYSDGTGEPKPSILFLSALVKLFGDLGAGSVSDKSKKYVDTLEFCQSIRDYTGRPINFNEQMDAQEFFGNVIDRLEDAFKQAPTLLQSFKDITFGGSLVNQITPECDIGHISRRTEPLLFVSVDVKNLESIEDGLAQFFVGETLDGENQYFCEKCDRKVSAIKQTKIGVTPNLLAVHLKRFEFNYQTFKNEKMNSRCSFPLELDIRQFCDKGSSTESVVGQYQVPLVSDTIEINDSIYGQQYIYDLVGIVVHEGNSDSGHYFSIIKDRNPANEQHVWYEFNDRNVTKYNIKNLERDCFGGVSGQSGKLQSNLSGKKDSFLKKRLIPAVKNIVNYEGSRKTRNAYLLFYAKRLVNEPDWGSPVGTVFKNDADLALRRKEVIDQVVAPSSLALEYRPESLAFLWDLAHIHQLGVPGEQRIVSLSAVSLKLSLAFINRMVRCPYPENEGFLRTWTRFIKSMLRCSLEDAKWMIQNVGNRIIEPIFLNPEKVIRRICRDFVIDCVKILQRHLDKSGIRIERTMLFDELSASCVAYLPLVCQSFNNFSDDFFVLLLEYVHESAIRIDSMVRNHAISSLLQAMPKVDAYGNSPYASKNARYVSHLSMKCIVQLLDSLIRSCSLGKWKSNNPWKSTDTATQVHENEISQFFVPEIMGIFMRDEGFLGIYATICMYLAWPSPRDFLKKILPSFVVILKGLKTEGDVRRFVEVMLRKLLSAVDSRHDNKEDDEDDDPEDPFLGLESTCNVTNNSGIMDGSTLDPTSIGLESINDDANPDANANSNPTDNEKINDEIVEIYNDNNQTATSGGGKNMATSADFTSLVDSFEPSTTPIRSNVIERVSSHGATVQSSPLAKTDGEVKDNGGGGGGGERNVAKTKKDENDPDWHTSNATTTDVFNSATNNANYNSATTGTNHNTTDSTGGREQMMTSTPKENEKTQNPKVTACPKEDSAGGKVDAKDGLMEERSSESMSKATLVNSNIGENFKNVILEKSSKECAVNDKKGVMISSTTPTPAPIPAPVSAPVTVENGGGEKVSQMRQSQSSRSLGSVNASSGDKRKWRKRWLSQLLYSVMEEASSDENGDANVEKNPKPQSSSNMLLNPTINLNHSSISVNTMGKLPDNTTTTTTNATTNTTTTDKNNPNALDASTTTSQHKISTSVESKETVIMIPTKSAGDQVTGVVSGGADIVASSIEDGENHRKENEPSAGKKQPVVASVVDNSINAAVVYDQGQIIRRTVWDMIEREKTRLVRSYRIINHHYYMQGGQILRRHLHANNNNHHQLKISSEKKEEK